MKHLVTSLPFILICSLLLRIAFFLFGLYQDANMPLPYTDIDYYVFTDASKFVASGLSPFLRATYRYTPLLSWILVPTTYGPVWFSFGKFIFIICDLLTGYLSLVNLPSNLKYLSLIWFFNPMVITISTRGSSESLLTSFILLMVHFLISSQDNIRSLFKLSVSGLLLGLSVHLKIYPLIYAPTLYLFIDSQTSLWNLVTVNRLIFTLSSLVSFLGLTYWMYCEYGNQYIYEAFIYHLVRLDHRHNFSVYNVLLYLNSFDNSQSLSIEKLAFVPQLGFTLLVLPLMFRSGLQLKSYAVKSNILLRILFIQTFVFIMFNKVCTSQYFIWFLCLLPQFISTTTISYKKGFLLLLGWVLTQALWLYNGWRLEFKGDSNVFTFGIFSSSALFFLWNTYMACVFIRDVKTQIQCESALQSVKKN